MKFEEVIVFHNSKRIPLSSKQRSGMLSKRYPYYGAQGIIDYVDEFIFDGEYLLIAEDGENLRSRNKEIAQIAKGKYWVNNHAHIVSANDKANLYYLKEAINRADISGYLTGSAQPKLNKQNLSEIQLLLPSKLIQDKIGNLIKVFDEKQTINNEIINKIEEYLQNLFKKWFIDFEFPNENGQPYRSSGGEMVDSELGRIPEGWHIETLSNITEHRKNSITMNKIENEYVHHFSIPNFDSLNMSTKDKVKDIKSSKFLINDKSLLFSKLNPNTPRIWNPIIPNDDLLSVASTEFVILESVDEELKDFILALISSTEFTSFLLGQVKGSTGSRQRVSPQDAIKYSFAFNKEMAKSFSEFIQPMYKKIQVLRQENEELKLVRDTLLPKLLSGELELPVEANMIES